MRDFLIAFSLGFLVIGSMALQKHIEGWRYSIPEWFVILVVVPFVYGLLFTGYWSLLERLTS